MVTTTQKTRVRDLLKSIETGESRPAASINPDRYIQHNPHIGDGPSGLGAAPKALAEQGIAMKYDRIHRVLGQGSFVVVVSEGNFGERRTSFYDLFRVDRGTIAEHWDVIETIPPRKEWRNGNGKF